MVYRENKGDVGRKVNRNKGLAAGNVDQALSSSPKTPRAWTRADLEECERQEWLRPLTVEECEGLLVGLCAFEQSGKSLLESSGEDFPFANIEALLADVDEAVSRQLGFVVLRGMPINHMSVGRVEALYWGLCNHLGVLRPQGRDSDLLGCVRDAGGNYRSASGRGYNTNAKLDYHTDFTDLVGLLCINAARSGGESRLASSIAVRDEMAASAASLEKVLFDKIYYSRQGEESPDEKPFYAAPIFSERGGYFSCRYVRNHIRYAHHFEGVPHPSERQIEAMDLLDSLVGSKAFTFEMTLQPGDLQILNNHVVLHSRTDYIDYEEPRKKRHLLRSWIATPNSQPLDPALEEAYHDVRPGAVRGGIIGQGFGVDKERYTHKAAEFHGMPS